MLKEEYKKLNEYLDDCFKYLEMNDWFLLDNIYNIGYLSELYIQTLDEYEIKENEKTEYLSYEEVYLLAREIVENINSQYLEKYDNLLATGQLDFSYNSEYYDSHFFYNARTDISTININRTFNYSEVCTLVHEFMHFVNFSKDKNTNNRYLFTEFISIYFEEYARNYLLYKGINKEKLNFNERIMMTKNAATRYNVYSILMLAYKSFGFIDENTFNELNNYFHMNISEEEFNNVCKKGLDIFQKIENKYKIEAMYEFPFNEKILSERMCYESCISLDYRYIMGTVLAYYQLKNGYKDQMIYLSEYINSNYLHPIEILKTLGIDL